MDEHEIRQMNRWQLRYVDICVGEWIRADLNAIGRVAQQITVVGTEFERATSLIDSYADALGSAQLTAALDSFASDWAIHRKRLIADLSKEAQLAQGAVDAYQGTDASLTAALDKMTGGG
jgi:hypothetical protein